MKAICTRTLAICFFITLFFTTTDGCFADKPPVPDLTRGEEPDDKHDWNPGATGARGWIRDWRLETTDSRQILITKVDSGSPAHGVLSTGDVILGVNRAIRNSI